MDGWSNIHTEPIVYFTITIYTSGHPHTSEYLQEITLETVTKCEKEVGCYIRSFMIDNDVNMVKMRKVLRDSTTEDVITYGCCAHHLNLWSQDLNVKNVSKHKQPFCFVAIKKKKFISFWTHFTIRNKMEYPFVFALGVYKELDNSTGISSNGLLPVIVKYLARSDPFQKYMFTDEVLNNVSVLQWWRSQKNCLNFGATETPSSVGVERVFSTFGVVQSKLRNKLGNEKVAKLVFLYKHLNSSK
ncbi:hypothetical protein PR048_009456 [Dryococelus australis]|uniref:Transposase n=1 Tax=Dryococelus australis TaxID=614101 RepID=A0ABQ9HZY2_9NEOP|nr:hypothetical protein PR048_009456 [Dryococelus australis]